MRKGKISTCKRPKNKAEAQLWDQLTADDWLLVRKGWPDFAAFHPDGRVIFIEVKPTRGRRLKTDQLFILRALAKRGFDFYRWSPGGGYDKTGLGKPDKHR